MTTNPPETRRKRGRAPAGEALPMRRCRTCPVRNISLCSALADRDLAVLYGSRSRLLIPAARRLDRYGGTCGNVVSGTLKLSIHARDGREQIVGLLFAGDFFGAPFALETGVTATALAETELCVLSQDRFAQALDVRPPLRRLLLERTIAALDQARDALRMLRHGTARERVAAFLDDLAARDDSVAVRIPARRRDIANFLGLSAETVSRELARLRAEGAIRLVNARDYVVLDRATLAAIANR